MVVYCAKTKLPPDVVSFEVCCHMSELGNQCLQLSAWILTNQTVDLNFEIRIKVVALDVSFQVVLQSFESEVYSSRYGRQKVQR